MDERKPLLYAPNGDPIYNTQPTINQTTGENYQESANAEPPQEAKPTPVAAAITAPQANTQNSTGHSNTAATENQPTKWRNFVSFLRPHGKDIVITLATVASAVATAIYAHYAAKQWRVMDGTLREMERAGESVTHQTWQAIGNINWLARTMQDALTQNKKAAESSETRSREALNASVTASHREQRAWIIVGPHDKPEFKNNTVNATFRVVNAGKTPALNVRGFVFVHLLPRTKLPDFSFVPDDDNPGPTPHWHISLRDNVRFPSTAGEQIYFAAIDPFAEQPPTDSNRAAVVAATPELIRSLTDPASGNWIAVHGRIDYQDIFYVRHWITFCWDGMLTMYENRDIARACVEHNNSDKQY